MTDPFPLFLLGLVVGIAVGVVAGIVFGGWVMRGDNDR